MNKYEKLLIAGIDSEITGTRIERLCKAKEIFESEMLWKEKPIDANCSPWELMNLERDKKVQRLQDWLQGLCSTFDIPFTNHDILAWYKSCRVGQQKIVKPETENEVWEQKILNNYFLNCAKTLYELFYQ